MFSDPYENICKLDLDQGMKIIDIGAGSGHHAILLAKEVGKSGRVYAVDVQQDLLTRLKTEAALEHLHNIDIVLGNAEKLGGTRLKDALADRIFISNVLFQIEHKDAFVQEMKRLLVPGGKLVVIDWARPIGAMHADMIVGPLEASHLFEQASFVKVSEFDAGDHHYGILFKSKQV